MGTRPRVLLVDDDEGLLESTQAVLEDTFQVLTATTGSEALHLLRTEEVDIVCADFSMPGMSGTELLDRVADSYPTVGRLLVTAMTDQFEERGTSEKRYGILLKPYDPQRLEWMLRQQARIRRMRSAVTTMTDTVTEES